MMIVSLFPLPLVTSGSWAAISAANPVDVVETWLYSDSVSAEAAIQALYQILMNG